MKPGFVLLYVRSRCASTKTVPDSSVPIAARAIQCRQGSASRRCNRRQLFQGAVKIRNSASRLRLIPCTKWEPRRRAPCASPSLEAHAGPDSVSSRVAIPNVLGTP